MTANSLPKIGGILLAAGGSSRLGRPKQLVKFEGKTLIRRAAATLISADCDPVVVVLGAETDLCAAELTGLGINVVVNSEWETGMSSSIRAGLGELLKIEPGVDAVVITLCDQPFISSVQIDALIDRFREASDLIVAAKYRDTVGVPALFSSETFGDLVNLKGDKGARQIIRRRHKDVASVSIEEASFDVDTDDDEKMLRS